MSISAQNPDIFGDRQSGQDDCTQEVMACQDVSNIAKTSLGPVGLDLMGADDIGDVTIETDAATILRMLEVEQPAASVFDRIRNQATAWHAAASKNFKTSLGPVGLDRMRADDIGDVAIETDAAAILRLLEVELPTAKMLYDLQILLAFSFVCFILGIGLLLASALLLLFFLCSAHLPFPAVEESAAELGFNVSSEEPTFILLRKLAALLFFELPFFSSSVFLTLPLLSSTFKLDSRILTFLFATFFVEEVLPLVIVFIIRDSPSYFPEASSSLSETGFSSPTTT
ncbi:unnamed protein product [Arabidopsis lyrata]|nr:unnamed protein product [Arabidopsis lyrata]